MRWSVHTRMQCSTLSVSPTVTTLAVMMSETGVADDVTQHRPRVGHHRHAVLLPVLFGKGFLNRPLQHTDGFSLQPFRTEIIRNKIHNDWFKER